MPSLSSGLLPSFDLKNPAKVPTCRPLLYPVGVFIFFCFWQIAYEDKALQLGVSVRQLQEKCKFSQLQTEQVANVLRQNGSGKTDLRGADRKLYPEAGVQRVELHGCSNVDDNGDHCPHIYVPTDKRDTCPKCGHASTLQGK